jgi:hypothetical protein
MSLTKILTAARRWFAAFFWEQSEMAAKTELFLEAIPWREAP